ncbi:hypothetical protein JW905_05640 [bacterium]|nr:hypothetical protein [candidate division CSSED10-310 bacterium]
MLQDGVRTRPNVFRLRSLAQALIMQNRCDEAFDVLDQYQRLAPKDGKVYMLRGDCYRAAGNLEEMRSEYERALLVDPHRISTPISKRLTAIPSPGYE